MKTKTLTLQGTTGDFLYKGISTDDARPYFKMLHVEEDWIVTTDGKQVRIVPNTFPNDEKLPIGDYNIIKQKKGDYILIASDEYTFPSWRKVVPDDFYDTSTSVCVPVHPGSRKDSSFSVLIGKVAIETGNLLNLSLIKDIHPNVWRFKAKGTLTILQDSSDRCLCIASMTNWR